MQKQNQFVEKHDTETVEMKVVELYPRLRQFCHFISLSKWDGDDIAQEVMAKVLDRYTHQADITQALLNKMANNHWVDVIRKRKYELPDEIDDLEVSESNRETESLMEVIESLLTTLTPKQAVILTLKEGFRYKLTEIAQILDTTEVSVKSSLHRIRKKLDKSKREQDDVGLVGLYWNEEEREFLYKLLFSSLESEDPTILIKAIPSIRSLRSDTTTPMLIFGKKRSLPKYSPSCTLSMAA